MYRPRRAASISPMCASRDSSATLGRVSPLGVRELDACAPSSLVRATLACLTFQLSTAVEPDQPHCLLSDRMAVSAQAALAGSATTWAGRSTRARKPAQSSIITLRFSNKSPLR